MKKIIKSLILVVLLMPVIVKADMSPPYLGEMEAIISNENGAISESGEKLEYGQKVKLENIYITDKYYSVSLANNPQKTYKILIEDLSPLKFNIEDFKREYYIRRYAYKDTKMYLGPAAYYDEIEGIEIPAGTVLNSNYYSDLYMYVTYNGVSGWVYSYNSARFGYLNKDKTKGTLVEFSDLTTKMYSYEKIELLNEPVDGQKTGQTIPMDAELNIKYVFDEYLYVEHKGNEGWVHNDSVKAEDNRQLYITQNKINVYDSPFEDAKIIGTLTKDQQINTKYIMYTPSRVGLEWFYVKNNEIEGWVSFNTYVEKNLVISFDDFYEFDGTYKVYKSSSDDSEVIGNVQLQGKYKVKYRYYGGENLDAMAYIENINGISGWISTKKVPYVKLKNTSNIYEEKGKIGTPIATIDKNISIPYHDTYTDDEGNAWYEIIGYNGLTGWVLDKSIEPKNPTIDQSKLLTKKEFNKLYYILGGTIGLVIITGTTIILVNKKKKSKIKEISNNDN